MTETCHKQKTVALGYELQVMWAVIRPDFFGLFSNNLVPSGIVFSAEVVLKTAMFRVVRS